MPLGNSKEVQVGDFVVAIGNPFGLGQTVTSGIVSALGRSGINVEGYEDFIQTDASINPGNSGGALIDLDGELIGINTAILTPGGGNVGIGFAVPADMAKQVISQVLEYGEVRRGRLGVYIQSLTPDLAEALELDVTEGAVVTQVEPGSAAERADLEAGDVIIAFDGEPVTGAADLRNKTGLAPVGTSAALTVLSEGRQRDVEGCDRRIDATRARPEPRDHRAAAGRGIPRSRCAAPAVRPRRGRARGRCRARKPGRAQRPARGRRRGRSEPHAGELGAGAIGGARRGDLGHRVERECAATRNSS